MRVFQRTIAGIKFGILSPEQIREMSVAKIVTPDTYDEDGYPIEGGLMDPKLGVVDPGLRCKTCGARAGECPGHFGRIELARPVIHVGYAKHIARILKIICRECSRIKLPQEKIDEFRKRIKNARKIGKDEEAIIDELYNQAKQVKVCPHCGAEQGEIKFEKPTTYLENGRKLTPSDVRERLEKITDEDAEALGFDVEVSRPEYMVLTVLPVPPVTVRPSIILESGERSEDDLTHKLVDIIRINQRLQENIEAGAPQIIIEDLWELLQYHVTTYFNNEVAGIPPARHRSGRPLKTLAQRLKGKEGRFRGNLSGKRVNFSARTVISPDPNISINEVGVPIEVARELTVPVRVTPYNIDYLRKLVKNGAHKYPGANYVERPDGSKIRLDKAKSVEKALKELDVGYIVHRHLQDGDIVLFNRQPSLHRMSIMAHEVRVMPGKTFRLNLCVCPPYNADFDGDEMNLHAIQGEEARAEARMLMRVQDQILSPRFGGPIIGGIHDHISGAYLFTKKETKFRREEALQLLYIAKMYDEIKKLLKEKSEDGYYTGKQIFSLILPEDLNLRYKAKVCKKCETCLEEDCPYDAFVVIKNGKLIKGVMDEKSFGAFAGELLDRIVKDYGTDKAREFLDKITRLVIAFISKRGFTTGIDDEDLPEEAKQRINEILTKAEEEVQNVIEMYEQGLLEPLPGRTLEETLEMRIMQILSEARDKSGQIANEYLEKIEERGKLNGARIMAISGARGSLLNLTQMAACVGQQSVRGERIKRGYSGRTLPHFKKGDIGAKAKGFVKSSYKSGLSPTEFFFHAMGGREGLVDTAVRTSQSGYMQRRLINALQDLKVEYDNTVRDARYVIVAFRHGEDGADPARTDWGKTVNVKKVIEKVISKRG